MCTKRECKYIGKNISKVSYEESYKQLVRCEKCCFKKEVDKYKDQTYLSVRLQYVANYHSNLTTFLNM